jgi:hypothetical protein
VRRYIHILEHWRLKGRSQSASHWVAVAETNFAKVSVAAIGKAGVQSDRLISFAHVEVLDWTRMMAHKALK